VPVALWLAIAAALVIEAAALMATTAFGDFVSLRPYVAELLRVAVRATILAGAIAIGLVAPRASWTPGFCATMGAVFGPLACIAGRAASAAARVRLGLPVPSFDPTVLAVLGLVRSAEFGTLGLLVGRLAPRSARPWDFAKAGLAVAVVFGGAIVAVRHELVFGALSAGELASHAIEETRATGLEAARATSPAHAGGRPAT
jgi:hypothetical protein